MVRRGAIKDATLIRSAAFSKNRRRGGDPVDPDADWTRREKQGPTLGYELHAAVDEDSGIVRKIAPTPASRHERSVAEAVVPGDVGRLWADAAYDARKLREGLEARGIAPVIAHDPRRRGLARARGFTLSRNLVDVTFRILAFDLRRAVTLAADTG